MAELKPCPFCGSDNIKVHVPYFTDAFYQIQCYGCNCATTLYRTEKEAIDRWNTRFQVGEKSEGCEDNPLCNFVCELRLCYNIDTMNNTTTRRIDYVPDAIR